MTWSLRHKLAFGIGGVVAACVLLLGAALVRASSQQAFETMRQRGVALARLIAAGGGESLDAGAGDFAAAGATDLETVLDRITGDDDLIYVEVVDAGGRPVAEGGLAARRPAYDFPERGIGIPRAPAGPEDVARGVLGEPLYIFTFPIHGRSSDEAPQAAAAPGSRAGLGIDSAVAAPRARPARSQRLLGEVRLAFAGGRLAEARGDLIRQAGVLGVLAVLASVLLTSLLARRLVEVPARRIAAAAERLAHGNLEDPAAARRSSGIIMVGTPRTRWDADPAARDEDAPAPGAMPDPIGSIGRAVEGSRRTMRAVLCRASDEAAHLEETLLALRADALVMLEATQGQEASLRRIAADAESVAAASRNVAASAGGLSKSSDENATSILVMVASNEEVAGHADGLTMSVNDTAATTEEMVAAIREIDRNVELLNRFVAETSEAMQRMGRVIQKVERNAADSKTISEVVAQNADKGMRAVELTIETMERIRGSVVESGKVIESVGSKGREIGLILNVIQEVTEQTNLLALNAAIIAAQAGEHGRGFAVLAEEIRQLAERTAASAKEIENLIASFRSETERAVATMHEGSRRVEEGVGRSKEAGVALQEILASARRSSAMVGEIVAATREQAEGSQAVAASVDKVRDMVVQIKRATAEQTLGSEQIKSAVENMREMAGHVKRATLDQSKGSRLITQAIGNITGTAQSIQKAAGEQVGASERVRRVIEELASVNAASLVAARRAQETLAGLRSRVTARRQELGRFHAAGPSGPPDPPDLDAGPDPGTPFGR
jgi:methyl-accepting chemotaxis protein